MATQYCRSSNYYSSIQKLFDTIFSSGEECRVRALFQEGVDIDAWYNGETPLLCACSNGRERIVDMLIKSGANVDYCDGKKYTALHYASENGWITVVRSLVKKVSDINSRDIFGQTALYCASREGHLNVVKCLLKVGADIDLKSIHGFTPLIIAANYSYKSVFDLLLTSGAKVDGNEGWLLYFASQNNWTKIVQSLIKRVPDWNKRYVTGKTNLNVTSSRRFLKVVKFLLGKGTDTDTKNKISVAALVDALCLGYLEVAKWLVKRVHDLNASASDGGMTALLAASHGGNLEVVKFLVEQGADINARNREGIVAMHMASMNGSLEVVKYFVEQGADISAKDFSGMTPLQCAAKNNHKDVVELLVNLSANVDGLIYDRCTLLHVASGYGWADIVESLVKKGCDMEAKAVCNRTALYYACANRNLDTVQYLLQAGARWDIVDMDGITPLNYVTCQQSPEKFIKLFIENGAHLKPVDYNELVKTLSLQVLQDVKLSSQSIINKFNNNSLPELYKLPASGSLPRIENMKIVSGSEVAKAIERTVELEIQTKGHCHILEIRPMALSVFSVGPILDYYKKKTELKNPLKRPAAVDPVYDYQCKSRRLN